MSQDEVDYDSVELIIPVAGHHVSRATDNRRLECRESIRQCTRRFVSDDIAMGSSNEEHGNAVVDDGRERVIQRLLVYGIGSWHVPTSSEDGRIPVPIPSSAALAQVVQQPGRGARTATVMVVGSNRFGSVVYRLEARLAMGSHERHDPL